MLDYPRPPGAHRFSFPQKRFFWKAPPSGSHRTCIFWSFGHTDTEIWRLKMCFTIYISAPSRGPLFQFPAKEAFLESPHPLAFT